MFIDKLCNLGLGLNLIVVATVVQNAVATTTSPSKGNADPLVFLKDATVNVQNRVAAASAAASSPAFVRTNNLNQPSVVFGVYTAFKSTQSKINAIIKYIAAHSFF